MDKMPESLPRLQKDDVKEAQKLVEEEKPNARERTRSIWIIVLAFALLASIAVIVWLLLSGRPDQKIHGENLETFRKSQSESSTEPPMEPPKESLAVSDSTVNLSDYDENLTITASGTISVSGVLNYAIAVNSTSDVILNLDAVAIPSLSASPVKNLSSGSLTLNFLEGKTSFLTGKSEDGLAELSFTGQSYLIFTTPNLVRISQTVTLSNPSQNISLSFSAMGGFRSLVYSSPDLLPGDYEVYVDKELVGTAKVSE